MGSFAEAEKGTSFKEELVGQKRQEKSLREFKEVLRDLVLMLRKASGMETVYMYWINRSRRQFVMETKSTEISNVVFQDRVGFDEHFLDEFKDIRQPVTLEIGRDIPSEAITHYYGSAPVRHITLLPFINNDEIVAITVLESADSAFSADQDEVIHSYISALGNVLNTYLEISDLHSDQNEWVDYEERLQFLKTKGHYAGLIQEMLDTMQSFLTTGGVSFITHTMNTWACVLNARAAENPIPVGMPVEKRSVAQGALNSGAAEFAIHFNRNPKRVSPRELFTDGATLAVPLMFEDFRKGVVVVYDENPLVFKESTKHKLMNIVRLTSLKLQAKLKSGNHDDPFLTNGHGAVIPDAWERMIDMQVERIRKNDHVFHTWVGMVTPSELSKIRTKFRLDELDRMQKDLVRIFNPGEAGVPGFVGFHADYIYLVVIQSKDPNDLAHWVKEVKRKFSTPVQLTNGKQLETGVRVGFVELDAKSGESYHVVSQVKKALDQ